VLVHVQEKSPEENSAMQGVWSLAQEEEQPKGSLAEQKDPSGMKRRVQKVTRKEAAKEPLIPSDRKCARDDSDDMELDDLKRQRGVVGELLEGDKSDIMRVRQVDRSCAFQ
jgi:hypothetical protein